MKYLYNGISLQNKRQSNMDSLLLKDDRIDGKKALLVMICDGVGSMKEGDFASSEAVRMLSIWFSKLATTDRIGLKMRDAILDINTHIINEAKCKNISTASTLSAILILENNYYIVHVGDSRIYSLEHDKLLTLTTDDTSDTGKLTGCIGKYNNIVLHYSEGTALDKVFIVCSDGLYKRMDTEYMLKKMKFTNKRTLKETIENLTQYVIKRGEQDNISLAIAKIES